MNEWIKFDEQKPPRRAAVLVIFCWRQFDFKAGHYRTIGPQLAIARWFGRHWYKAHPARGERDVRMDGWVTHWMAVKLPSDAGQCIRGGSEK